MISNQNGGVSSVGFEIGISQAQIPGIDESVFKYVLKYMYVLIPLPNLNPNLIYFELYFELYFEVGGRTYTPTSGATGLPYN